MSSSFCFDPSKPWSPPLYPLTPSRPTWPPPLYDYSSSFQNFPQLSMPSLESFCVNDFIPESIISLKKLSNSLLQTNEIFAFNQIFEEPYYLHLIKSPPEPKKFVLKSLKMLEPNFVFPPHFFCLIGPTTWLAFPCFGISEIISIHEKKVSDLAISKFHKVWIVPSKIVANVIEIALLPASSIVNVVAALFNVISRNSRQAKFLLNITKEYWTHGISLLFKRIFVHTEMKDSLLKDVISSNLHSLNNALN